MHPKHNFISTLLIWNIMELYDSLNHNSAGWPTCDLIIVVLLNGMVRIRAHHFAQDKIADSASARPYICGGVLGKHMFARACMHACLHVLSGPPAKARTLLWHGPEPSMF